MNAPAATTLVVAPAALAGEQHRIEGSAYHHLVRVKRLEIGERLRLVDGAGRARFAELASIGKRDALARLGDPAPANEPALAVELFVAPPKPERAAWLVEKATELGVVAIRFVATERTARDFGAAQLERLRRVAVAAVEQCGRARLPEISVEEGLEPILARLVREPKRCIVLDASGESPFAGAPNSSRVPSARFASPLPVAVLVGPEGGWSEAERELLAHPGIERWSLGGRTLRVETATVVAAGILLSGS